jgi:hypothetical protein
MKGFPQQQLDDIEPSEVQHMVTSLMELHDLGKPQTDQEYEQRIHDYFSFCQRSSIRPGVESLALSLHCTRQSLFNWKNGVKCSPYRQEIICNALQVINAFMEASLSNGKVSPPSGIFLLKNWAGYKDVISFEETAETPNKAGFLTASQLPRLGDIDTTEDTPDTTPRHTQILSGADLPKL